MECEYLDLTPLVDSDDKAAVLPLVKAVTMQEKICNLPTTLHILTKA